MPRVHVAAPHTSWLDVPRMLAMAWAADLAPRRLGAATGNSLILGKANKAGAVTTVKNTGKGSALNLVTKSATTAPLTTKAKGMVKNFYAARAANADTVGGLTVAQITTAAKGAPGAAGPAGATGPAGPLLATLGAGQTETGA